MFWQTKTSYEFGPFVVDTLERQLLRNGELVPLTPKVFDILLVFVQNSGHILSKDAVMKIVWPNTTVEEGNLARNISTLRKALGENSTTYRYVETIPWRGYRFLANVREVRAEFAGPAIESIAVLPFVNVGNVPDTEYLSDGIAESLIDYLSQLPNLRITSRNSAFRYRGREIDTRAVGRELKVQAVVLGRIADREGVLSVRVELVDARDDHHIWGAQYNRELTDIFSMQDTLAKEITARLRIKLTDGARQRVATRHPENMEAYHSYLKGRYYFNKLTLVGVEKGIEHFQHAIETDPQYAMAHAALADCYIYLVKPVEARNAVSTALAVDDSLGEAHASLGFLKFIHDWDFRGAENEFKQALSLNANYAEAHHWSAIFFANVCRHSEAATEAMRAVELDPLSLLMNMTPALTSYLARQYEQARDALEKIIEMDATFVAAQSVLGNVYLQQELFEKAMVQYEKVLELSKGIATVETAMKAVIAQAHARWGKKRKAVQLVDKILAANTNVSAYSLAGIYAALGEPNPAFACLDKAFEQRDPQLVSLKVDPAVDELRSDPRFSALMRRVGLPE